MKRLYVLCLFMLCVAQAKADEAKPALQQSTEQDQLAVFQLKRGWYVGSDLGIFMTLGGVRGYSNVQPFVSVKAGRDLGKYISLQLALSSGYASGNPVSRYDDPNAPARGGVSPTGNYSVFNAGLEVVGAIRPVARVAIQPQLGAGLTYMTPQITDPSNPARKLANMAPHVMGGVEVDYLTLLTDFSAGLAVRSYYIVGPDVLALSTGAVLRYTF